MNYTLIDQPDRPWVTFIPGIGNDATFWQSQADALAHDFRILMFDPWGHGSSPPPPPECGFDDIWHGVVQLWDQLGIERSSVVGLGFGGSLGLRFAIDLPSRVDRVIACCCRPRQPDERRGFWRARQAAASAQGMEVLADATVDRWLSTEFRKQHPEVDKQLRDMMKRTTLEGYLAAVGAFIEMDFTSRLPELTAPTLLLAAEHDHGGGPVPAMREMAEQIPHATLNVIPGSGHICNHEAPDIVNTLIHDFLSKP
ncbi:alpha/beta fold hydrolase [Noviherbaspirillum saxi]|uniref:alpha/beta fold hydrolase n=1 Tax=Noviherbaspirillum saxi TaxID=2320863 RepID=UPI001F2552CF|nr:alpha/beta hydrolase [Noviherbaspirillum saxi]